MKIYGSYEFLECLYCQQEPGTEIDEWAFHLFIIFYVFLLCAVDRNNKSIGIDLDVTLLSCQLNYEINARHLFTYCMFSKCQKFSHVQKKKNAYPASSSLSNRADSTDSLNSFASSIPIVHCTWQVLLTASSVCTVLMYVNFSWSTNTGVSMCRS